MKPFTFAVAMVEIVLLVVAIRASTTMQKATSAGSEEGVATMTAGGGEATAVTVSADQRVFVSFPGRHPEVDGALAEVKPDGAIVPYPSREWNAWSLKSGLDPRRHFVCVASLACDGDGALWALDSGRLEGARVSGAAKLVRIDLASNRVSRVYAFRDQEAWREARFTGLRIDADGGTAYLTDEASGGVVKLDLATGRAHRIGGDGQAASCGGRDLLTDLGLRSAHP